MAYFRYNIQNMSNVLMIFCFTLHSSVNYLLLSETWVHQVVNVTVPSWHAHSNPHPCACLKCHKCDSLNVMPWQYKTHTHSLEFVKCFCGLLVLEVPPITASSQLLQVKLWTSSANTPDTRHLPVYNKPASSLHVLRLFACVTNKIH